MAWTLLHMLWTGDCSRHLAFSALCCVPVSFIISAYSHVSARLPLGRLSCNFILGTSCKSGKKILISLKLDKSISHFTCTSTSVLLQQYQMLCFCTNYWGSPLLHFCGKNQQVYVVDRTMCHNIQREPIVAFPWKCFLSIHIVLYCCIVFIIFS
jgi:hypothetical protein